MFKIKTQLLFAILFLVSGELFATHIVGGGMTYECLGNSGNGKLYRFTMKVYVDCFNGQISFDAFAPIAIYIGTEQSNELFTNFEIPLTSEQDITVAQPDCIDNLPTICIKEGIYTWEQVLPASNLSYFVEYQRCCRTNAITNIVDAAGTGATYVVEITPLAQQLCNNSPTFNNFPPVLICNNYPLEIDYSATDPDGDLLVYSFCAPYAGGGNFGGGCFSPTPIPPCPPPFPEVIFVNPDYSATAPMAGNPVVSIDAQTGVISGTPQLNGQYVVGVCVQEFRNGVLLSETRRDFQFNVSPCAPQVTALVPYDELAGIQQYVIKECDGTKTITIVNQSFDISNISNFEWTFDLNNGNILQNSTDFDLTITLPDFGIFTGTLVLNQGLDCGDTAFIQVELYPPATLELGQDILVCKDSTIVLDAGTGFDHYQWQDGSTAQTFSATATGNYHVVATDACGNVLLDSIRITLSPIPEIQLADLTLCPGEAVTLSVPGFAQYSWSPAAGLNCTSCPTVIVQPAASTAYFVSAINQDGCETQGSFEVTVLPTPMITRVIQFFPNQSVVLGGVTYTQPDTVVLNVLSTTGGCDSLNTYILELLPTAITIQCPDNITVPLPNNAAAATVNYTNPSASTDCPGTPLVELTQGLASGGAFPAGVNTVCYTASNTCGDTASCCFTVHVTTLDLQCPANLTVAMPNNATATAVNYALPTATSDCPGATPTISLSQGLASGGNFPAGLSTVCYAASNTCGNNETCCFTVKVTTLNVQCPANLTAQLAVAETAAVVNYAAPTSVTDCPPATLNLLQGQASGGTFGLGLNKVCYEATTSCGNRDTCCFNITVLNAAAACDIKTLGCMRYELLDIRLDSIKQPRFRIRITNFCASELDYAMIELPPGIVGVTPINGGIYTAPNTGNQYLVRNPNASPFYSTRYRSVGVGINNNQSDVLEQRLPQQSFPNNYIHMNAKLKNGQSFEAYLNTFNCPVQPWAGSREEGSIELVDEQGRDLKFSIRPNPNDGLLFVDLSQWLDQSVQIQVLNAQGQLVLNRFEVGTEWLELNMSPNLPNGLYYLMVKPAGGEKMATKFVLAR